MRSLGTKALVLLFALLAIACAFDGPEVAPSSSHQDSPFCGVLYSSTMDTCLPTQPEPLSSSSEVVNPLPGIYPLWSLAQSIDHPPELPA
jgi:hypothetical protein